jgi:hypothetical protein
MLKFVKGNLLEQLLTKKVEKLASHFFLTKKIIVTVTVKIAKMGHFQNFFWVFIFGHF